MDTVYKEAFAEVLEVIKHCNQNIKSKIPEKFITFLNQNEDKNYIVKIDFTNANWEDYTKYETQAILALIYRDYIVSPEEREKLLTEEKDELIMVEKELREKYNTDNIFQKHNQDTQTEVKEIANNITIVKYKDSIFKKIMNVIKKFFGKI